MAKRKAGETVTIEVHFAEIPGSAVCPRHIEVSPLSALQGGALKRVTEAAQAGGIRLQNGRFVTSFADGLRYILEQIGEAGALTNGNHKLSGAGESLKTEP